MAQAKMALQYDKKHRIPELKGSVYLRLARTGTPGYHLPKTSFPSHKEDRENKQIS